MLQSKLADATDLEDPSFNCWMGNIKQQWRFVLKQWEMCYACQTLYERGKLIEGSKGICFGTGLELLPSYFASLGCHITATDLPPSDPRHIPWRDTGQYIGELKNLNKYGLCEEQLFVNRVILDYADMNNIPPHLLKGQFDFSWSLCSMDHCGTIALGKQFLLNQMQCLKSGGVAVHTTAYNISTSERPTKNKATNRELRLRIPAVGGKRRDTIDNAGTVLWLKEDMVDVFNRATALGYKMEPLKFGVNIHKFNTFVDTNPPSTSECIRLKLGKYTQTSFGFILTKP